MVATSMGVGGVQNVVRNLSGGLIADGHEVGVVSLTGTEPGQVDHSALIARSLGLPHVRANSVPRAIAGVIATIHEFRPDVVHSHAFHSNAVAGVACALTSTPSVRTIHSTSEGDRGMHRWAAAAIRRLPGTTTAVSRTVAQAAGLGQDAVVVHNGIDADRFRFRAEYRETGRQVVAARPEEFLIVSVGRLTQAKNYPLLIDAAAMVQAELRAKSARIIVVGEGELRDSLEAQVAERQVGDLVHLVGSCTHVPVALSAADAYVQSSSREGFPLAPLEAMRSGLPILATRAGGTAEIEPTLQGYVAVDDVRGLAEGLVGLADLRGQGRRKAQADAVAARYGIPVWSDAWTSIYEAARRP